MLLIEKMETALDTIREVDIKSSKETVIDRFTEMKDELKDKVIDAVPFASESSFIKLEKKVGTLSRKMNQLKKQLKAETMMQLFALVP